MIGGTYKVLVTGAAGFIGSHLCRALLQQHVQVIAVDNFDAYYSIKQKMDNLADLMRNQHFKFIRGDFSKPAVLKRVGAYEPDMVIHLAAKVGVRNSERHPAEYLDTNVTGTVRLWEQCAQWPVHRFIYASSSSVYGNIRGPFSEDSHLGHPLSMYALSKKTAEDVCRFYADALEIPAIAFRFFSVYGPGGRPDMAPSKIARALLGGTVFSKFGDGSTERDFTYIDDIVDGVLAVMEKPLPSRFEIINLGSGRPVELNTVIAMLERISGRTLRCKAEPRSRSDMRQTFADIRKAKKLLDWMPQTEVETGLKNLWESLAR